MGVAPQAPRAGRGRGQAKAQHGGVEFARQAGMRQAGRQQMHGDGQVGRSCDDDQTICQPLNPADRHPLRSALLMMGIPADLRPSTSIHIRRNAGRAGGSPPPFITRSGHRHLMASQAHMMQA